jgi:hypothetical protein
MATQWGYVGANNRGWFGSGTRTSLYRNILVDPPEPIDFNPTDVSGLAFWLDADDPDTIETDETGFGVLSWSEKLRGLDVYTPVDALNPPLTNRHTMNGVNVVYFPLNAALRDTSTVLDFNDRTVFVVCKPLAFDVSGLVQLFHGDATGDQEVSLRYSDVSGVTTYSLCSYASSCGVQFEQPEPPTNTRMILSFVQSSTDLASNAGFYDTFPQTLVTSNLITFNPDGQYYLSAATNNQAVDIAEILVYDRVISTTDIRRLNDYLAAKWG